MSSVEEVKAELVVAEQTTLPQVASMAISLAEEVDMVRGTVERLSAGSSNPALEQLLGHLRAAYETFVEGMGQVAEAKVAAGEALTLM